ncbi:hypothetical protein RUND412_004334 [Rhizina undulata]
MTTSTANSSITYASGATGDVDLRLLHYNDAYHIDARAKDSVGGAFRFISLVNHYRDSPDFAGQLELLTFFSGDAFNPSLESFVTKGQHMVPLLNNIGTNVARLGNHDLDFGVEQFKYLAKQCTFPWLLSIAGLPKTVMLEASNGLKVGIIGLVEKEWLDTINTLPPGLKFISSAETAKALVPGLREAGADIILAVSHQRELNDVKLAEDIPTGLIDIVLGGHDHYYAHQIVNGCHIIRSGSDFKQLSYIEARRKSKDGSEPRWNFDIIRRDITKEIPEDPKTVTLVETLNSGLKEKLEKPIGHTANPTKKKKKRAHQQRNNCDVMRFYYSADTALVAGGNIRGDTIYSPGAIKFRDIVDYFPFEDPNGISKLPALEGRFPHVSNNFFEYDPALPAGERIHKIRVRNEDLVPEKKYTLATRAYMANGRDGYDALTKEEGAEEVIDEVNGVIVSTILCQYFLSLKVLGKWCRGDSFKSLFSGLKKNMVHRGELVHRKDVEAKEENDDAESGSDADDDELHKVISGKDIGKERMLEIVKKAEHKWSRLPGVRKGGEELTVDWTRSVAPRVEGRRIKVVTKV